MNNNYDSVEGCIATTLTHSQKQEDTSYTATKRNWLSFVTVLVTLFCFTQSNAQVTVTNPSNTTPAMSATYTSLSLAIADVNTRTAISGPVIITLDASSPQTAPAGGYSITNTAITGGSNTNRFIFDGGGNTITAGVGTSTTTDAFFKIIGADFITLQNFVMAESSGNTTATTQIEWGIALLYSASTNGAQNCTIQNNTITLNRTNSNTFGIYSNSTHSATSATTSATATTTAGGNSGLKVYGNTISNVNQGIVVVGPTAAADLMTGVDIGGSSSTTGNIISNFGTAVQASNYANVSGTINGILIRNAIGFNVSYNTITSSNGGVSAAGTTLRGIFITSATPTPTGTFTNTTNNNTIALTHGFTSGSIQGIVVETSTGTATSTQNINNNNFTALGSTVATSGTITAISNVMPNLVSNINGNTFTNITSNTTGSFTFISNNFTRPANGTSTVNNNSIVTAFNKTGAGGTVTFYNSNSTSPVTVTETNTGNNFSNITVTGATTIAGWVSTDGSASSPFGPSKVVTNNTFNNIVGGTNAVTLLNVAYSNNGSTSNNVSGNTISNVSSAGTITGVTSANGAQNFFGNTIFGLSSSGASAVTGVNIGNGTTANIYQNKIYNLLGTNAGSTVNGIIISGGLNINTYNNIVGDLRATAASGNDVIRGINITSSTALSTLKVYNNTIRLNSISSGANFGSTGIFHTYSATATTAALDMRNNIIVNASSASGTGLAVAFRRSAATDLLNYATTSNNNLFFGTSGVYTDGTNIDAGLSTFQTRVSTRETNSKSQNPTFASTTGSDATFLHFESGALNLAGSFGQVISGYTTDFDGDVRDVSTPDIGADEWSNGVIVAPSVTSFTPSVLCTNGGQSVTFTGTGLDTVTSVLFNGSTGINLPGVITSSSTTSLTVTIPVGVVSGGIIITNPAGPFDTTSTNPFTTVAPPTIVASSAVTICSGTSTSLTATGGATYSWSPATGLATTTGSSVTASPTVNTTYTVTGVSAEGCSSTSTVAVTITIAPSPITIVPPAAICSGGVATLTANGGSYSVTVLNENFNTGIGAFTSTTASSTVAQNWTPQSNGYVYSSNTHSGSVSGFMMANSDVGGSGSTANTRLISPSFSTIGLSNLSLNFKEYLNNANDVAAVEISDDNFVTSIVVIRNQIATDIGSAVSFANTNLAIPSSFQNKPNVKIRFRFEGTYDYWWAIDEIVISGSATPIIWSPQTDLYTDAAATLVYTGGETSVVYAKLTAPVTYTATSTVNGCAVSASTSVSVNPLPSAPTGSSSLQCGTQIPSASVADTNAFTSPVFNWYDVASGGVALQSTTSTTYTSQVSATKTFYVSVVNPTTSCESSRVDVTVTVSAPDAISAVSSLPTICLGQSVTLTSANSATSPVQNYTYSWLSTSGSGVETSQSGASLTITPTSAGTFTYTVTAVDGGCQTTNTVVVNVNPLPAITTATASPAVACVGSTINLDASIISIAPGTATIGTGTTLTSPTSQPTAFCNRWPSYRMQTVYTAAELQASGLRAGNITSMAFNITTLGDGATNSGFVVKMGSTSLSALTTFESTTAYTTVYPSQTYTHTASGLQTIPFSTPYVWDGTSNIIVDLVHNGADALYNSETYYTATTNNTVAYTEQSSSGSAFLSANRLNVVFGGQVATNISSQYNWSWNTTPALTTASGSTTLTTSGSITYAVVATNLTTGCSASQNRVVTSNPLPTVTTLAPATVCYPSTVDLTASAVTTGSDSGLTYTYFTDLAATTSYATPAAAVAGTYYIKGTNANGCSSIASVVVSVNQPAAPTGSTTADFCGTANMTNLSAVGSGIKWYDAATAGNQIPVLSVVGLTSGTTYYASQTVAGCESVNRLPVAVTIIAIPSAPNASSQTFCNAGTVADLAPSGSGLQWYDVATNGSALTTTTPLITGTYFVSQTSFMCEGPRTSVTVTVNTTALPTAPAQTFCGSATIGDLVATGSAIKWYDAITGGSALASTATLSTTNYYASQTLNGCEGPRIQVPVTVNTTAAPSASAQTFCTSATVADLVAIGSGLQWYAASTGGSALASTASLASGTYFVSQTVNSCESSRLPVNVTITTASTPTGTSPQAIFGGVAADATIEDISVIGANVIWYPTPQDAAAGINEIVAGTEITNGSTYFAVSVVGACRSNALAVTVTVTLDRGTFDVANFTYYPNPTSDIVNISYADEITQVRVFNMLGQEVVAKKVNATTTQIDLSQFASGTYFVEVTSDQVSKTVKVIKK